MPHSNYENDYVLKAGEVRARLKKDGIKAQPINASYDSRGSYNERSGCFFSEDVTVNGKPGRIGSRISFSSWKNKAGAIPNSHCPDCGAQGYYTDHPCIATCGAYPGWFYYYKDEENEQKKAEIPEYIIKILNGQYVRVKNPAYKLTNERK